MGILITSLQTTELLSSQPKEPEGILVPQTKLTLLTLRHLQLLSKELLSISSVSFTTKPSAKLRSITSKTKLLFSSRHLFRRIHTKHDFCYRPLLGRSQARIETGNKDGVQQTTGC